jgi:hypothetical protein
VASTSVPIRAQAVQCPDHVQDRRVDRRSTALLQQPVFQPRQSLLGRGGFQQLLPESARGDAEKSLQLDVARQHRLLVFAGEGVRAAGPEHHPDHPDLLGGIDDLAVQARAAEHAAGGADAAALRIVGVEARFIFVQVDHQLGAGLRQHALQSMRRRWHVPVPDRLHQATQ